MKAPHLQTAPSVAVRCKRLFKLERSGRYEAALDAVSDIWPDQTSWPRIGEMETAHAAEVLLRCGSLIGFAGHIKQLPDSQKRSEDLLTRARQMFEDLDRRDKVAECENYIALGYWRAGELNEARAWIDEALSHDLPVFSDTRLYSHVIRDLIFLSAKEYRPICNSFENLEETFIRHADNFLKGNLYNNYGVALKNLGQTGKALHVLETGRDFYYKSGNRIHCGLAENNLAQLYRSERKFPKAHTAIDNATALFKQIKDKTREGFSLDTKALIYLAEGKYGEALWCADRAIRILQKSENSGYLAETYLTKSKILLYSADLAAAVLSLLEAVKISSANSGEAAAKKLVQEFEIAFKEKNASKPEQAAKLDALSDGDLELILPASLARYEDYRGVWINNEYLEDAGLRKGSLAIVVTGEVQRGDLVAVMEIAGRTVSCGLLDKDFGMICLERAGLEPVLFNENDVRIIGKIVGVCNTGKNAGGKMQVEALRI